MKNGSIKAAVDASTIRKKTVLIQSPQKGKARGAPRFSLAGHCCLGEKREKIGLGLIFSLFSPKLLPLLLPAYR